MSQIFVSDDRGHSMPSGQKMLNWHQNDVNSWCQLIIHHRSKMKVFVRSTVDIKLTWTVGIKLISHTDIYLTIQLDVNLMLHNLLYVHEINTRKIIFLCNSIQFLFLNLFYAFLSIMDFYISGINNMAFQLIYIITTN